MPLSTTATSGPAPALLLALLALLLPTPAPAISCTNSAIPPHPPMPNFLKNNLCKRNLPNYDDCIIGTINVLRPYLIAGIPELNVPSLDLIALDDININRDVAGVQFQGRYRNLQVFEASNFTIEELRSNRRRTVFDFKLQLPKINFVGDYEIRLSYSLLTFFFQGEISGNFTNFRSECHLKGNECTQNGTEYLKFDRMDFKVRIDHSHFYLRNLFNGNQALDEIANRMINDHSEYLLSELLPSMEISLANVFTEIANKIMLSYPINELLPV